MQSYKQNNYSTRKNIGLLKGLLIFFLGMSCMFFVTEAFDIVPVTRNVVQYIQSIFLTQDGYSTSPQTIALNGVDGSSYFEGDMTVDGHATFGPVLVGQSPSYTNYKGLFDPSGILSMASCTDTMCSFGGNFLGNPNNLVVNHVAGRVGVGTSNPVYKLDVAGAVNGSSLCIAGDCKTDRPSGGTATVPAGNTTRVQFNNAGSFGASANLTRNSNILNIIGTGQASVLSAPKICLNGVCETSRPSGGTVIGGDSIWSTGTSNEAYYNSGNVGIGTGEPTAKLHIAKTWAGGYLFKATSIGSKDRFWIHDGGDAYVDGWLGIGINSITENPNNNALLVSGTSYLKGNVGIGISNPTQKLDVAGDIRMQAGNGNTYMTFSPTNGTTGRNITNEWGTTGAVLGVLYGTNRAITFGPDKNVAIGYWPDPNYSLLVHGTGKFNSGLIVNGRVGIGTDAPSAPFHVKTPAGTIGRVALFEAGGSTAGQLEINGGEQSQMVIRTMKPGIDLKFGTHLTGAGTYNANQLYLKNDGNVGIGTVPGQKLHIDGNLRLQNNGSIYFSSNDWLEFTDGTTDGYKFMYDSVEKMRLTAQGRLGIGENNPGAMLTVDGGIKPKGLTSDPCGTAGYPEGTIFYNNSDDVDHSYLCFCNYQPKAKKMHHPTGLNSNCEF